MKFTVILLIFGLWAAPLAQASGPVETSPFAMQGVEVDETDVSAKAAKDKALVDVQMKALVQLGEVLGGAGVSAELAKLDVKQVMPLLKSLSIEKELISPGHYKGTFTVRFLPQKLKPMLAALGVKIPDEQGPAMMVIPVWTDEKGQVVVWEDTPWRKAWGALHAAQAPIPLIVPLGDQEDTSTLSSQDVTNNNAVKIEAIRRRYDVKTVVLAFAQPAPDNGIHVHVTGSSALGKITIDKIYTADTHTITDSTTLAAQRFQQLITDKFRSDQAKVAAKAVAGPQALAVTIPFAGPSEWNGLRSRILSTPGVVGLDVTSLDGQGAAARLMYSGNVDDLGNSLQATGLRLARNGGAWLVVPL
jgi:hypothetical protein